MSTHGVIGLGAIGSGVAAGWRRSGFDLVVCDVAAAATEPFAGSARVAASPADLAATAKVIAVAVVNDAQVLDVLTGAEGLLPVARPGTTVILLSTVSTGCLETAGRQCAGAGVDLVDCGVSGGPSAAAKGRLVSMVGGDTAVIERVRPALDGFSSLVVHMGPVGTGLRAKLARNLVQYGSWLAAFEAQRVAEASGIELSKLAEVIRASDELIGGASALMFRDTVAPFGPDAHQGVIAAMRSGAALATKDLDAVLALGAALGLELPAAALARANAERIFGLQATSWTVAADDQA